jgi:hypothetical protein
MDLFYRKSALGASAVVVLLVGCSVAKLEARLEANPQCKDIINPKTGALMPCPETDKAFYRSVGLAPAKPTAVVAVTEPTTVNQNLSTTASSSSSQNIANSNPKPSTAATSVDCKPQIHKKTGGILPCPAPD